jgi:hypothetical protein
MLLYAVKKTSLNKIVLCFLEKGHTQNENDSVHATVEVAKRKPEIFVPHQYFSLVRAARKNNEQYHVHEMAQCHILDFKDLASKLPSTPKHADGRPVKWRQIRQISVQKETPDKAFVAYGHREALQEVELFRRTRRCNKLGDDPKPAYDELLAISRAKFKDLQSLCAANAIPHVYHQFYTELKHTGTRDDHCCDSDCSEEDD